ncbi:hypothetical protein BJY01DRAFT_242810 [Aspergillus pseudoustus]|uniref:FAD-binding PCMH-type domain-containing protein n=1 Tax=Aspergillus pseudoustus TaxID=1810923 RepID=A0ABR4KWM0_9EURO
MVRVSSVDQVATVVRFATDHEISFTTRGGGYSTSGASIAHGGIVLDLSKLRAVHVSPESHTVTVQGGALWADVDVAAARHHLVVVGSTLNQIGVAGATLGGGYGWLTGQYGLAIDNLLWVKMVLADGSIVTASETAHADLFWAIRGAGLCFGVAVELGFRAHRQEGHVFAGTLRFAPDKLPRVVAFVNQFESLTDGRQGFWFGFTMQDSVDMDQCHILVVLFYNGSESQARQFFRPVLELDSVVDTTQMLSYDGLNGILNTADITARRDSLPKIDITHPDKSVGFRRSLRGSNITLPLDAEFVQSIYDEFSAMVTHYPQARDSRILLEFVPNGEVKKVANSATAFASRGPYYNVSSLFEWAEARLDDEIRSRQKGMMDRIGGDAGIARHPGYNPSTHGTGLYANYAGRDVPVEEIFGSNISRLRELKQKYDSHNTFRKWHNLNKHANPPD